VQADRSFIGRHAEPLMRWQWFCGVIHTGIRGGSPNLSEIPKKYVAASDLPLHSLNACPALSFVVSIFFIV